MKVSLHRQILEAIAILFSKNNNLFTEHSNLTEIIEMTGITKDVDSAAIEFQDKYKCSVKTPYEINLVYSMEILSEIRKRQFTELVKHKVEDLTLRDITLIFKNIWTISIQELKTKSQDNLTRLKQELELFHGMI